ncbi:MAG TPA: hypothetical protein VGZ22_21510 [Isosphaeraceae bacterium]|nr:hypothetical protein [Isosphaeraceae bacterium]
MRHGPRRLPLIALGALVALIALILAGTYIFRERGSAGALVATGGSGGGGGTTEVFTVDSDWDLRWSYDCSPSLTNLFRKLDRCDFFLTVKQMSDCQVSPENPGIIQHLVKNQAVVHYHAGGTFYFVVDSTGSWTAAVIGSGRAWGVGPAPHCSEG